MPLYIRKGLLEIPPGSEKDWASEEQEEDYFLRDPEQAQDCLPQPYRMIDKVVELVIDQVLEIIKIQEKNREAERLKVKINIFQPTAEIQVSRRVNCVAAGASGTYLFAGLSEGLAVYSLSDQGWICGWEADNLEVCSLGVCQVQNQVYLISTVDDMGIARLFYFIDENLHFLKAFNEPEDISKRTVCKLCNLSDGGDYAGVLLEGNEECWLEVYKLPKDTWLKEMEHSPATTAGTPVMTEPKVTQPVLLMKIKPPKALAGSLFKTVQEAVQGNEDSSVFGTGQNHIISSHQWDQQEAIFLGMIEKYLSLDMPKTPEGGKSRRTMFNFLQPNKLLHSDTDAVHSAIPNAISVHWNGHHNHLMYLLAKPAKDKADIDLKPDIVWPCAAPIRFSAVSSCAAYLALCLDDETLTVWDIKYSGFPLAVVALPEGRSIGNIYFLGHKSSNRDYPSVPRVQILVLGADKSLYLVNAAGGKESSLVLLQESPGTPDEQISAVVPVSSLPNGVLLFYRSGIVELLDVVLNQKVCQFGLPLSYKLAFPWQPVYALDSENLCLFLKANEKVARGEMLATENGPCTLFSFTLDSVCLMESVTKAQQTAVLSHNLHWEQKCKSLFQTRLQTFPERRKQIAASWTLLRKQASDLTQRDILCR
ncbi:WD repeat-containing protein 93 [Pseudophryne corroboree]|uniref:WD repeat-containing protein 93 n=1 Tax=Pseudophryne corroboree TaxID=495146 RepID=UPI003081E59A